MRPAPSLSRRCALLIAIISPAFMGSYFQCVFVSNPTVAVARIDHVEPRSLRVGDVMQVSGSGDGTPPLDFAWDFGDGALVPGMQAAHAYTAPGDYLVTLTVRDANGNVARDSSAVSVSARLPAAMASLILISDPVAGRPVELAALPLEANGHALIYKWTFSDGQTAAGSHAAATFQTAGMYVASVTVTNEIGAMTVAQIAFQVMDADLIAAEQGPSSSSTTRGADGDERGPRS